MAGMNSSIIDLIYLDPPFNSKRNYESPVGQVGKRAAFKDVWSWDDADKTWLTTLSDHYPHLANLIITCGKTTKSGGNASYLLFMAVRLIACKRLLKDTGSIYLHVDPTMSHYLKAVMDAIFDERNFRNEIIWCYAGGGIPKKDFPRKSDSILRYTKTNNYQFNIEYRPYGEHNKTGKRATDLGGTRKLEYNTKGTPINNWWTDIKPVINWSEENTGYPTQKPLALLERIISISSNNGDVVLDPFCGGSTTLVASQKLNRKWIGIDIGEDVEKYANERFQEFNIQPKITKQIPKRTDGGGQAKTQKKTLKKVLYTDQAGVCNLCAEYVNFKFMEIDHIIPVAKGGVDYDDNKQLLCGHCNKLKGDKTMDEAAKILERWIEDNRAIDVEL